MDKLNQMLKWICKDVRINTPLWPLRLQLESLPFEISSNGFSTAERSLADPVGPRSSSAATTHSLTTARILPVCCTIITRQARTTLDHITNNLMIFFGVIRSKMNCFSAKANISVFTAILSIHLTMEVTYRGFFKCSVGGSKQLQMS